MAKGGYILLHRSIMDHWIYDSKPYDKLSAWIDLLLLANYEDKKVMHRGKLITCKRGTVNLSITSLANRWGWNWRTAKRFILELEKDNMCQLECRAECTTITIVNYDNFQTMDKKSAKQNTKHNAEQNTNPVQSGVQTTNKDNKYINENKEKASPTSEEEFIDYDEMSWFDRLEDDRDKK